MMAKLKFSRLSVIVTVAVCSSAAMAAVVPMTVNELAHQADLIIVGDVTSVDSYRDETQVLNGRSLIMSSITVQVSDYLKGDGGETLTLEIYGGTVDGTTLRTSVTPTFLEGDHVLLFLEGPDNLLVGAFQGAYLSDGELAVQMQGGFQRYDEDRVGPLEELLDDIRFAVPDSEIPTTLEYEGEFSLSRHDRQANFSLLQCNWNWQGNPMGESYRVNGNCVDSGCGTPEQQVNSITLGSAEWDGAGADFSFNFAGTTTATNAPVFNGQNLVVWKLSGPGADNPGAIASTFFWCSGGNMTEWDMVFNDLFFNFWNGVGACNSRYDIQAVGTHEFGHCLGLGHSGVPAATMWGSTGPCNTGPRSLHSDDIAGIIFIYGTAPENGTTTLPFFDDFPTQTIDTDLWIGIDGAEINATGVGEPSGVLSLNLAGSSDGGDEIRSAIMNTTGEPVTLEYYWQRTGAGNSPEAGEDLFVEYRNNLGNWVVAATHPGEGPDDEPFQLNTIALPSNASHSGFRLRFRAVSTDGGADDWFIDDVSLNLLPAFAVAIDSTGVSGVLIGASPPDNNGIFQDFTPFSLLYTQGISVTLSAPSTASGLFFRHWLVNEAVASSDEEVTFEITGPTESVAAYETLLPVFVDSSPNSGVTIGVSPSDYFGMGDGSTPFIRLYFGGENVTLEAPLSDGGLTFTHWTIDDVDQPMDQNIVDVDTTDGGDAVANYADLGGCLGDLDDSGTIDAADLAVLLGSWGACAGCPADLNGDDIVDAADLAILLGSWGPCP